MGPRPRGGTGVKTLALRTYSGVAAAWATSMLLASRGRPWLAIGTGALVIVAFVAVAERGRVAQLLRPSVSHLGLGLAAGALMIAVTYVAYPLACLAFPSLEARTAELYTLFLGGRTRTAVLAFVVPIVAAEEVIWRGPLPPGARPALLPLTALLYAAAHLPLGSLLLSGVAFVCGLYWLALRRLAENLVPPLVCHLMWDIALVLVPLVEPASAAP